MEQEQLKIRLENLRDKVSGVESLLGSPYNDDEIETELSKLEEELDNFRFYLEERLY